MTDLEAAIAAEMKRQGCHKHSNGRFGFICREHLDVWIDTHDACPVVADAVRAGYEAAINATAEATCSGEPVQRKAGRRLSPEYLAVIRRRNHSTGFAFPSLTIEDLLAHIDAVESELASCRAGQPRHKDQT